MKKIDRLLLNAFWPPLVLAFGLVMFVFTMQSMWKFVDDIIGKGASVGMIVEFVMYLSIGLIPLALPAAILLSSLFVMGNMAEKYELTAMKSAGVSLWRIMRPLMLAAVGISIFSFVCSNYIAPTANLKFRTRLQSFKSQKLALSLNEGVFNDDFRNFSIRIAEKNNETGYIKDILLYDHSSENRNRTKIITAKDGTMDMSTDERFLIMRLNGGQQFQEMEEQKRGAGEPRSYPYMRLSFDSLDKYMDLSEFEMVDTDEERFREQEEMLSVRQLIFEMDTMTQTIDGRLEYIGNITGNYFFFVRKSDSTAYYVPLAGKAAPKAENVLEKKATLRAAPRPPKQLQRPEPSAPAERTRPKQKPQPPGKGPTPMDKIVEKQLHGTPGAIADIFPESTYKVLADRAKIAARSLRDKGEATHRKIESLRNKKGRYMFHANLKFSLAVACIIFLLIGAPLGAITRKGGFGYPVLTGTVLFVLFVVMVTLCEKMQENNTIPYPALAAWLPAVVYGIPCFFLTRGAVRDAKMMNIEFMEAKLKNWFSWRNSKQ